MYNLNKNNTIIHKNQSISEAIIKIAKSKIKILFVINNNNKLLGSISSGDLRRSISKKIDLKEPVEKIMFKNPKYFKNKNKDLSSYKDFICIPIVNEKKEIIDLQYNKNLITNKKNTVFLMAGGKGSRLYPLTKSVPKPLLKINNVPIIERIIENFKEQGFYNFKISINYLGSKIKKYLEKRKNLNVKIKFIREKKFLGTAGSLSITKLDKLAFPIILTNSDLISNINYKTLLGFHIKNKADLTICVRNQIFEMPYGEICLEGKKVSKIIEKPISNSIVNAGVYVLSKKIIKLTKPNKHLMMNELINTSIKRNCKILSFPIYENWIDVGSKDQLLKAKNLS